MATTVERVRSIMAESVTLNDVLELEQWLREDLAAIQRVKDLIAIREKVRRDRDPQQRLETIEDRVVKIVEVKSGPFGLDEVIAALSRAYPTATFKRTTISSTLYRLKEAGRLKLIREGIGQRAAIYEKI